MTETKLSQKHCVACEGIGKALEANRAKEMLRSIPGWKIDPAGKKIIKKFQMKNFMAAVRLINEIAKVAEEENHHPDLHLTDYRGFKIELSTHALCGLSENDFILAAKINELPLK